jgi:predicted nucleic acid-binding protein
MKRCLADVNVLLPLLVRHHEQHELALRWFDGLATGDAYLAAFSIAGQMRLTTVDKGFEQFRDVDLQLPSA